MAPWYETGLRSQCPRAQGLPWLWLWLCFVLDLVFPTGRLTTSGSYALFSDRSIAFERPADILRVLGIE